jgi:aspartate aminotransferase
MDPGDEIIRTILRKLQWFSAASGVNVVSVISSIDTGFALPAIADFEKLITPKQKRLFVIQETQRVICILKKK